MGIKLKIENVEELRDTKIYMVGRLARQNEIEQPISVDIKSTRFIIIPLCQEPEPIEDVSAILPNGEEISYYIGFDSDLKTYLPIEYKYCNYKEKGDIIEELLQDKLIIFRTNIIVDEINRNVHKKASYRDYKIFKNITVENILEIDEVDKIDEFVRIPKLNINEKDFILKLKNREYIEFVEYPTYLEEPEYIICGNHIYYFEADCWVRDLNNKNMWSYEGNIEYLIIFDIKEFLSDRKSIIWCSDYTYFITKNLINHN